MLACARASSLWVIGRGGLWGGNCAREGRKIAEAHQLGSWGRVVRWALCCLARMFRDTREGLVGRQAEECPWKGSRATVYLLE